MLLVTSEERGEPQAGEGKLGSQIHSWSFWSIHVTLSSALKSGESESHVLK